MQFFKTITAPKEQYEGLPYTARFQLFPQYLLTDFIIHITLINVTVKRS